MASVYKRKDDKTRKGAKWRVSWYDAESGRWRDKVGYSDKEASVELGRRLERQAARRAEGMTDPMDEHRRRSLDDHLNDFIAQVKAGERCPRYVLQLENRLRRIVSGIDAERLHDLDPVKINRFLASRELRATSTSPASRLSVGGQSRPGGSRLIPWLA
jgi:hypothetical protein